MASLVVLVTGGSGFLGQHIIKHLHLYGSCVKEIRVLDIVKYDKNLEFQETKPVKSFVGSITDQETVSKACHGVDAVLHIASYIDSSMFPNKQRLYEVNVKGTETVLAACKENNVSYLVYCSSISTVQGHDEVRAGTETTVPVPERMLFPQYGSTKYTAQKMVLAANGHQLTNGKTLMTLAILPLTMYGELDNNFVKALEPLKGKQFPRLGKMRGYVQFAYVGNIAYMFVKALESLVTKPGISGQILFGADDTPASPMTSFLEPILKCLKCSVPNWYIPYWIAYLVLFVFYYVLLIVRCFWPVNPSLTFGSIACSNTTFYVTYDKAQTLLGYKPLYDYEASLEKSIAFYTKI